MNATEITRLLYSFRPYRRHLDYVQILTSTFDTLTGKRDISRCVIRFEGIVLPVQTARKFVQDIGYLAADKNFTYGALNDFNTMTILFGKDDMPDNFSPDLNGYIHFNRKRYERVTIQDLQGVAWIMRVQGVEGANPFGVLNLRVQSTLNLQQVNSAELN